MVSFLCDLIVFCVCVFVECVCCMMCVMVSLVGFDLCGVVLLV